jgi:AcrR family transcriptional regulator
MSRPSKKPAPSAPVPSLSLGRRARQPSRELGRIRFQLLLEATEDLLKTHSPGDLGLYQIAERAKISPGTVYHFFPTINAVFIALAERYHQNFHKIVGEPARASRLISWQDLLIIRHERAVKYYNEHLPTSKILLGAPPSWEIQQADANYNESTAPTIFAYFDRIFLMPHVKDPEVHFEIMLAIAGAIWSISFRRHGTINGAYAEEAITACIAYCRKFLPERVERRPEVVAAAASGGLVSLA